MYIFTVYISLYMCIQRIYVCFRKAEMAQDVFSLRAKANAVRKLNWN